jgi:hypothetical protein
MAETFSEEPDTGSTKNRALLASAIGTLGAGLTVGGLGAILRYGRDSSLCDESTGSHCPEIVHFYRHVGTATMWAAAVPALAGVTLLTIRLAQPTNEIESPSTTLQPIKFELALNPSEVALRGAF